MTPNRIEIDGVWYVREDNTNTNSPKIDITCFKGMVYETDKYCWEATIIEKEDGTYYDDIDIKFTDKRFKPWKEKHWDSVAWMIGVCENNPSSMTEAKKLMCEEGIASFRLFIQKLRDEGWL